MTIYTYILILYLCTLVPDILSATIFWSFIQVEGLINRANLCFNRLIRVCLARGQTLWFLVLTIDGHYNCCRPTPFIVGHILEKSHTEVICFCCPKNETHESGNLFSGSGISAIVTSDPRRIIKIKLDMYIAHYNKKNRIVYQ